MSGIVAHIISHSHWDREWYMPYEKHHVRLVTLMDDILALFDTDPSFKHFHLDGQTIVLDDYLRVRPEMRETVCRHVREGRLNIGPWYVLQDEFLTSSESNIRNLLTGMKDAQAYGGLTRIGYFPDSFGNIGQAPQILCQAGMKAIAFGRGVKPIGVNNTVQDYKPYESCYSEMLWESPDGSTLMAILFANWYNNGAEIPVSDEASLSYWMDRLKNTSAFASTNQLLFMNGSDHQPVQKDLSRALAVARRLFPDVEFVHSDLDTYVQSLVRSQKQSLATIRGELRSQETDGWYSLVNTASARVYIKQMNQKNQVWLERIAEPLTVFAQMLGFPCPKSLMQHAWRILMQNHPHDSICGCSVDEVHAEMISRFHKSLACAEAIVERCLKQITLETDTTVFCHQGVDAIPFIVYNTTGWNRTGVVTLALDLARDDRMDFDAMNALEFKDWNLKDADGKILDCECRDLGVQFGYDLPEDKFRRPYFARRVEVTFEAVQVPALGYSTFALSKEPSMPPRQIDGCHEVDLDNICETTSDGRTSLITGEHCMENDFLVVSINQDGTLDITDKRTGYTLHNLCSYEDTGDIGNEYVFIAAKGQVPIVTAGHTAEISLVDDTPFRATFEIIHRMTVPEGADELLEIEMNRMVPLPQRKAGRSKKMTGMTLRTTVQLEKSGLGVIITVSYVNTAKNHRLRVLLPTGIKGLTHRVDSIFEVPTRNNAPSDAWINPSYCHHQQAFVSLDDGCVGLTVANIGLHEYEILTHSESDPESDTIAITLLRAVGELGDWGVFPTPDAQCQGMQSARIMIIPHQGTVISSGAFQHAYQFQVPWTTVQTSVHTGRLPARHSFFCWDAPTLALTGIKIGENGRDAILRWFNLSDEKCQLTVQPGIIPMKGSSCSHSQNEENQSAMLTTAIYESNVVEEELGALAQTSAGTCCRDVGGAEIVTLGFVMPHMSESLAVLQAEPQSLLECDI